MKRKNICINKSILLRSLSGWMGLALFMTSANFAYAKTPASALAEYLSTAKNKLPTKVSKFNDAYLLDIDNDAVPELVVTYNERYECSMRVFEYEDNEIKEKSGIYDDYMNGYTTGKTPDHLDIIAEPFFHAERMFVRDADGKVFLLDKYTHQNYYSNELGAKCWERYTLFEVVSDNLRSIGCYDYTYFIKSSDAPRRNSEFYFNTTNPYYEANFEETSYRISIEQYNSGVEFYTSFEELPISNNKKGSDLYRYWDEISVYFNGDQIEFDQLPVMKNDRVLVPLRAIFEAMNANVQWDQATQTVTSTRDGVTIKLTIGDDKIYKNGQAITTDVPAQLINDRTMIPVRVIAEAFGAEVEWNGNGRAVLITE